MKRLANKFFVALARSRHCYIACSDLCYPGFYGTWELPDKNVVLENNPRSRDKEWDWLRDHQFVLVINDNMIRNQIDPADEEDRRRISQAYQEHH